jgi:hypothetical protein
MAITGIANALGQFGSDLGKASFNYDDWKRQKELDRLKMMEMMAKLGQIRNPAPIPMGNMYIGTDKKAYQRYQHPLTGEVTVKEIPNAVMPLEGKQKEAAELKNLGYTDEQIQRTLIKPDQSDMWDIKTAKGQVYARNKQTGKMLTLDDPDLKDYPNVEPLLRAQRKQEDMDRALKMGILPYIGTAGLMPRPGEKNEQGYDIYQWSEKIRDAKLEDARKTAYARGEGYNMNKMLPMLDMSNGGTPVVVRAADYLKNQSRYLPSNPGVAIEGKQAQRQDILDRIQIVKNDLDRIGDAGWDTTTRMKLLAGFQDDRITKDAFLSEWLGARLTTDQWQVVTDLGLLKEANMGLRNLVGAGGATDAVRAAGTALLPGAGTPDIAKAKQQLDGLTDVILRATRGLPYAPLPKLGSGVQSGAGAGDKSSTPKDAVSADTAPDGTVRKRVVKGRVETQVKRRGAWVDQ